MKRRNRILAFVICIVGQTFLSARPPYSLQNGDVLDLRNRARGDSEILFGGQSIINNVLRINDFADGSPINDLNSLEEFDDRTLPIYFNYDLLVDHIVFTQTANFPKSRFNAICSFNSDSFQAFTDFSHDTFTKGYSFGESNFAGPTDFIGIKVLAKNYISLSNFEKVVAFDSSIFRYRFSILFSKFHSDVSFTGDTFFYGTSIAGTTFDSSVEFDDCKFGKYLRLVSCNFEGDVDFTNSKFEKEMNFSGCKFGDNSSALFDNTDLPDTIDFSESTILGGEIDLTTAKFYIPANLH